MKGFKLTGILLSALIIYAQDTYAQKEQSPERCSVEILEDQDKFENWLRDKPSKVARKTNDKIYKIPAVVHVLHRGEPVGEENNISKERIEAQIRILNEDFRRKEGTPGFNTHPDGGDARIEFVLAKTSPDGEPTDGIIRVDMTQFENPTDDGIIFNYYAYYSYWNPEDYLNIWTVPDWPKDVLLGMATGPITDLPGGDTFEKPDPTDGIIINAPHFGPSDMKSDHNLGRTATHEIGHYLGLLHIWGAVGCDKDDYCEDTPPQNKSHGGCPAGPPLACDGRPAMIENYMDYTADRCMNIFTNDQISRMHTVLENSPRRKSLLTSPGLNDPSPVTGIPEDHLKAIIVYPNPVSDKINITFNGGQVINKAEITLYNLLGKKLLSTYYDKILTGKITLNLPTTQEKILFLKLSSEKLNISRKLVLK